MGDAWEMHRRADGGGLQDETHKPRSVHWLYGSTEKATLVPNSAQDDRAAASSADDGTGPDAGRNRHHTHTTHPLEEVSQKDDNIIKINCTTRQTGHHPLHKLLKINWCITQTKRHDSVGIQTSRYHKCTCGGMRSVLWAAQPNSTTLGVSPRDRFVLLKDCFSNR